MSAASSCGAATTDDHHGLPFAVVDKVGAQVFVFDAAGALLGAAPVLLGLAKGDDSVPGIGDRPLAHILPSERTTPAGRFVVEIGHNLHGHTVVWVDYSAAISMHAVVTSNPAEHRLDRLATPTIADNRISYGCINVPTVFFNAVVVPDFAAGQGHRLCPARGSFTRHRFRLRRDPVTAHYNPEKFFAIRGTSPRQAR